MGLTKRETKVVFDHVRENKGKMYGSYNIEKLKGGVVYKPYYEMISSNTHSDQISYIKLVFPDKTEIKIEPLTKLKEALKKNNAVSMTRYEFKKKLPESNYLYIFRVGNHFFDLPENMAKSLIKEL